MNHDCDNGLVEIDDMFYPCAACHGQLPAIDWAEDRGPSYTRSRPQRPRPTYSDSYSY